MTTEQMDYWRRVADAAMASQPPADVRGYAPLMALAETWGLALAEILKRPAVRPAMKGGQI